jgi:endo-alpha-1,4-polygalactosaminidase (GH114 family)
VQLYYHVHLRRLRLLLKKSGAQENARTLHITDVHTMFSAAEGTLESMNRLISSGAAKAADLQKFVHVPENGAEEAKHWSAQMVEHLIQRTAQLLSPPTNELKDTPQHAILEAMRYGVTIAHVAQPVCFDYWLVPIG